MQEQSVLQKVSEWASLLQIPIWGIVAWGWWSLKKIFVKQSDCTACREKIEQHQSEQARKLEQRQGELAWKHEESLAANQMLEERLRNLPTIQDLHKLELAVTTVLGDMRSVGSEIQALRQDLAHVRKQSNDLVQLHLKPGA